MAKTKTEKIADIQEQIQQLENQRKKLLQQEKEQERKDRTRRLCKRAGLLESMLPDTILLTDEQFKNFLEKTTANDFGRRALAKLRTHDTVATTADPTHTAQASNGDGDTDEGNSTTVDAPKPLVSLY